MAKSPTSIVPAPAPSAAPSRRVFLRSLGLVLLVAPLGKYGVEALSKTWRRSRSRHQTLSDMPWLGHC